jgi:hypothetical protein
MQWQRRLQKNLFEPDRPPANIPAELRATLLALLEELLGEAMAASEASEGVKQANEVGDDQDHD